MEYIRLSGDGVLLLYIHVQPRASKTKIGGVHGDRLKIAVCSPPVDGKANREILKFLVKNLGLDSRDLVLKSGAKSRHKVVAVSSIDREELEARITGLLRKS